MRHVTRLVQEALALCGFPYSAYPQVKRDFICSTLFDEMAMGPDLANMWDAERLCAM